MVDVGQIIELDLPGWIVDYRPSTMLVPMSESHARIGPVELRAIASGSQLVSAKYISDPECHGTCAQLMRQGRYAIIVVPAGQPIDLPVGQFDRDKFFLVTPGTRIVAAMPPADLINSDPAVVGVSPFPGEASLSLLTATRSGLATFSSKGFGFGILVKPPAARYDVVMSDQDGGKTIRIRTGQSIVFRLQNSAGFGPWDGIGFDPQLYPLRLLTDPAAGPDNEATTFRYMVGSARNGSISFDDHPDCWNEPNCRELTRHIEFDLEVGS